MPIDGRLTGLNFVPWCCSRDRRRRPYCVRSRRDETGAAPLQLGQARRAATRRGQVKLNPKVMYNGPLGRSSGHAPSRSARVSIYNKLLLIPSYL